MKNRLITTLRKGMGGVALLVVFSAAVLCQANDLVESNEFGAINWTKRTISAVGIGAPPENTYGKPQARPLALKAAQMAALRNILETVKGVQINSTTKVKNFMVESDIIESKVSGMVTGAREIHKEYMSDGTVEVTMEMPIGPGFSQLVLPPEVKQVDPVIPVIPRPQKQPSGSAFPESSVYSGLVVDARGLSAKPAMAPKIVDETGNEVYGPAYVSREVAVQQGMSGYATDLESAKNDPRVTGNPLIVKGLRTDDVASSNIVISNADASQLLSSSENLDFMKKCKVMIVVD